MTLPTTEPIIRMDTPVELAQYGNPETVIVRTEVHPMTGAVHLWVYMPGAHPTDLFTLAYRTIIGARQETAPDPDEPIPYLPTDPATS